jgi:hypothetical protein
MQAKCQHVKSKKEPEKQCDRTATKGTFCSIHDRCKKKVLWTRPVAMLTRTQRVAGHKLLSFLRRTTRASRLKRHGPAYFTANIANNETDIYTLDPVASIPLTYRFSYADSKLNIWLFDSRFLMGSMQYERTVMNPFTQEEIPPLTLSRLQGLSEFLQRHSLPLLYVTEDTLTPEQRWNQKVLDVFLRIRTHGYGVNVVWFESMTISTHTRFYTRLYDLWNTELQLTDQDKERIVPRYSTTLFTQHPNRLMYEYHTLKWWMKHNLSVMHTLLTASSEKGNRGCGALYILTALAQVNPDVAQAYPWL